MKIINKGALSLGLITCVLLLAFSMHAGRASAISTNQFQPGYIIDDSVFQNSNTMSVQAIQNFLNAEVGSCTATTGEADVCINSYAENPTNEQDNIGNPTESIPGGESAAQIIYNSAQQYQINPQVILATIEKEEGLVTDDNPSVREYQEAMGYECPDTSPCSGSSADFYSQVDGAAWQFRQYLNNPGAYNYWIGNNYIPYNPNTSCGGSQVYIQNAATAALYIYTPYQPNAATLAAPQGQAVTCGAYGNLNFWRYFNEWFGRSIVANVYYDWSDTTIDGDGKSIQVPVVLTQQPTSDVQITFKLSNTGLGTIMLNQSLFYTPQNYQSEAGHYITIQGNNVVANSQGFDLQVSQVTSDDPDYGGEDINYYSQQPLFWMNDTETAIYRLFNSSTGLHAYANSVSQENSYLANGYSLETGGPLFYQCTGSTDTPLVVSSNGSVVASASDPLVYDDTLSDAYGFSQTILPSNEHGTVEVYLLRNSANDTLLTTSSAEVSSAEGLGYNFFNVFYGCNKPDQPVYRLDSNTGHHFYTTSYLERNSAAQNGYSEEGVAFYLGDSINTPVYRLYNPHNGDHFYTTSVSEQLAAADYDGYLSEGVGFTIGTTPGSSVYRLYNPHNGDHFYTTSVSEQLAAADSGGYLSEGVGFTTP